MNYEQKYQKYKTKYLELKNTLKVNNRLQVQQGGAPHNVISCKKLPIVVISDDSSKRVYHYGNNISGQCIVPNDFDAFPCYM
jgi:hypothetical protein